MDVSWTLSQRKMSFGGPHTNYGDDLEHCNNEDQALVPGTLNDGLERECADKTANKDHRVRDGLLVCGEDSGSIWLKCSEGPQPGGQRLKRAEDRRVTCALAPPVDPRMTGYLHSKDEITTSKCNDTES